MSTTIPPVGSVAWFDLTVPNADEIRDFYAAVVGWSASDVDMGGYADYTMYREGAEDPVAGVCHARGVNAGLPPQWLMYVIVDDLDRSMARCTELGGQVIAGPKPMGITARYCVVQDPAGAVAGLISYRREDGD